MRLNGYRFGFCQKYFGSIVSLSPKFGVGAAGLHCLLPIVFFFIGFQFSQELVEVLLVPDNLFFRGFAFSQTHDRADGKTKDRSYVGTSLFCFDPLTALIGIFAVILD